MHSKFACPLLSLHSLSKWLEMCKYELSLILLGLGGFLAFAGGRFYKATFFLIGWLGMTGWLMIYFYLVLYPV